MSIDLKNILLVTIIVSVCWADKKNSIFKNNFTLQPEQSISIPIDDRYTHSDKVYLSFSARINSQKRYLSGSAASLIIKINNVPVTIERLRNKRKFYLYNGVNKVNWFWGNNGWSVSYYPWNKADSVPGGQVHKYVFDIKSLLRSNNNFLTIQNNHVSLKNAFVDVKELKITTSDKFDRSPLMVADAIKIESEGLERFKNLAIGYHEGVNIKLNTAIDYFEGQELNVTPQKSFKQSYELETDKNGRIEIVVNGEKYLFKSYFRTPNGSWRVLGNSESTRNWNKYLVSEKEIICENDKIILKRTIIRKKSHIVVSDEFKNKTAECVPVIVMNTVDFGSLDGLTEFRIAGNKQPNFYSNTSTMESRETGATPVVYLARKKSGLGILVQDDVYRNQATYLAWGSTLGVGDDLFYLEPQSQYTMVWKIFPVQDKNYYQMVNAIRADWDFDREIPGLFGFVHPTSTKDYLYEDVKYKTPKEIAEFLDSTGLNIASTLMALPVGPKGAMRGFTGNESIPQIRLATKTFLEWRKKARAAGCNDLICLPYLDVHLVKPGFDNGLSNVVKRMPDSLAKDPYGEYMPYCTGEQYVVIPTMNNSCGRHLMNVLRILLDEQKFEGLYLDEWDHSRARTVFNYSDGYSAIIDKDAKLIKKIGFVPLLTREFQKKFIHEIIKRKKIVFANQFDCTMSSAKLPVVHFAEPLGSYDYKLFAAQLTATPLSLHVARTSSVWTDVKEFLKRGVLTCYYFKYFHGDHILKKCFPITVQEVWPGCVVGKKKIITMCSGKYGLDRDKPLTAYIYSGEKAQLSRTVASLKDKNGKCKVILALGADEVAVVVEQE